MLVRASMQPGASCEPDRSRSECCSLAPPFVLGRRRKAGEGLVPEALDVGAQLDESSRLDSIEPACPLSLLAHESGLPQQAEMLRDRRPAHRQACGDLPDRERP